MKYFIDMNGKRRELTSLPSESYLIKQENGYVAIWLLGGSPEDFEREVIEEYVLHED